jgi:hypothetical protein
VIQASPQTFSSSQAGPILRLLSFTGAGEVSVTAEQAVMQITIRL